MISDETKRALKKCLQLNGFDASIVDELVIERKTLRDDFAKEAMASLIRVYEYPTVDVQRIAKAAYQQADRMLIEREIRH
jgi:hypothetical protein